MTKIRGIDALAEVLGASSSYVYEKLIAYDDFPGIKGIDGVWEFELEDAKIWWNQHFWYRKLLRDRQRISITELCKRKQVSRRVAYRWIRAGMPHQYINSSTVLIDPEAVENWLKSNG